MLGAMSVVPMLDVMAKMLSENYPVTQVAWFRFVFHTLWLVPLLYWRQLSWWFRWIFLANYIWSYE